MGTKYPTPPGDSVQPIVDAIKDNRRQTRDAQRPSGTNLTSLVAQVQSLVGTVQTTLANINAAVAASIANMNATVAATIANINATVSTAISANSYTRSVIDSKIANPGAITPSSVTVSGSSAFGPINSGYSRGHTVLSGYANAYWDGNGDAGVNVSSVVYKQDVSGVVLDAEVKAILSLALVKFRYIAAVEEYGDEAPIELGAIAEYVEAVGLGEWVFRDSEGEVQGISYERLTIPLIAVVQSLDKRLKALEGL